MEAIAPIIGWLAPMISTIIITFATASINSHMKRHDEIAAERHAETEEKRKADAKWRDEVDKLLSEQSEELRRVANDREDWYAWRAEIVRLIDKQDERTVAVLKGQCTQMRSDLIHRAHRYLDDLGRASTDEKEAFNAEYKDYCAICDAYGIENNFINELAKRVMALPEREI